MKAIIILSALVIFVPQLNGCAQHPVRSTSMGNDTSTSNDDYFFLKSNNRFRQRVVDPESDSRSRRYLTPARDPRLNPRLDPSLNPRLDPNLNPGMDPRLNPRLDPSLNPGL
jgi:hypothetical protein